MSFNTSLVLGCRATSKGFCSEASSGRLAPAVSNELANASKITVIYHEKYAGRFMQSGAQEEHVRHVMSTWMSILIKLSSTCLDVLRQPDLTGARYLPFQSMSGAPSSGLHRQTLVSQCRLANCLLHNQIVLQRSRRSQIYMQYCLFTLMLIATPSLATQLQAPRWCKLSRRS